MEIRRTFNVGEKRSEKSEMVSGIGDCEEF